MRHSITLYPDPEREAPRGRVDSYPVGTGRHVFGVLTLDEDKEHGARSTVINVGPEGAAYLDALAEAAATLAAELRAAAALTAAEGVAS